MLYWMPFTDKQSQMGVDVETLQPDGGHVGFSTLLWSPDVQYIIKLSCFYIVLNVHLLLCQFCTFSTLITHQKPQHIASELGRRRPFWKMAAKHRCTAGPQADKLILVGGP